MCNRGQKSRLSATLATGTIIPFDRARTKLLGRASENEEYRWGGGREEPTYEGRFRSLVSSPSLTTVLDCYMCARISSRSVRRYIRESEKERDAAVGVRRSEREWASQKERERERGRYLARAHTRIKRGKLLHASRVAAAPCAHGHGGLLSCARSKTSGFERARIG